MGNFKNNQSGFSLIEGLLVVLVLAVIGFGGYYVWNNQKKTDKNDATASTAATTKKTEPSKTAPAPQQQYLKIPEFGIELPVTSQIVDLSYTATNDGVNPVYVSLSSKTTLGDIYHQIDPTGCTTGSYPVEPNLLVTSQGQGQPKASVTVNGTTYYLREKGGHAGCYNATPTTAQQAQIDAYMNAVYTAVTNAKAL